MKVFELREVANDVLIWASIILFNARKTAKTCRDGRLKLAVEEIDNAIKDIQMRLASKADDESLVDIGVTWQKFSEGAESASHIASTIVGEMQHGDSDVDSGRTLEICKAIKRISFMASAVATLDVEAGSKTEGVVAMLETKVDTHMKHVQWPEPSRDNSKKEIQEVVKEGVDEAMRPHTKMIEDKLHLHTTPKDKLDRAERIMRAYGEHGHNMRKVAETCVNSVDADRKNMKLKTNGNDWLSKITYDRLANDLNMNSPKTFVPRIQDTLQKHIKKHGHTLKPINSP